MKQSLARIFAWVLAAVGSLMVAGAAAPGDPTRPAVIQLDAGAVGIGFDDLRFSSALQRVIVPGARTGNLFLIDPVSQTVERIGGFSSDKDYTGGHGEGITSADAGPGVMFVTDRSTRTLNVVEVSSRKIVSRSRLASGPDYVRYVQVTNEVWVTEPRAARIEIFSLHGTRAPVHSAFIAVPNGPESLAIDNDGGRAYTNEWSDKTVALDLKGRAIVSRWSNGCRGSRGIALDAARALIFAGCDEGKLSVLDMKSGQSRGLGGSTEGVDIIAYNPALHHAYLPGEDSASMDVIGISDAGVPSVLATVPTAKGAHCVTADDRGNAYVCDPKHGRLLLFHDSFGK